MDFRQYPNKEIFIGGFIGHVIFSIVSLIMFITMTFLYVLLCYERRMGMDLYNSKLTSKSDMILYMIKLITTFAFAIESRILLDKTYLILPFYLLITSWYLVYSFMTIRPYLSVFTGKYIMGIVGIFSWANLIVFIKRILNNIGFNGTGELFIIGIPLIIIAVYNAKTDHLFSSIKGIMKKVKDSDEYMTMRYIIDLIDTIDHINNSRIVYEYLGQFGIVMENTCINENCPIKRYLGYFYTNSMPCNYHYDNNNDNKSKNNHINSNINSQIYYLYLHVEKLYHDAINKFPLSVSIRISYALFVKDKLNKKEHSMEIIIKLLSYSLTYQEKFLIYRLMKLYDNNDNFNNHQQSITSNITPLSTINMSYQKHYDELVNNIEKATKAYLLFWEMLHDYQHDNAPLNQTKMNKIAVNITQKIANIKEHFTQLQKIDINDYNSLIVYLNFFKNILHEDNENITYINIIKQLENKQMTFEDNIIQNHIDISLVKNSNNSNINYVIASGVKKTMGNIVNASLGICALFGYSYEEIINKQCDFFLPNFMQSKHKSFIQKSLVNQLKDKTLVSISNGIEYHLKTITSYGKTKANYIIPLMLKVGIVPNEKNEMMFIAKFSQKTNNKAGTCFVLTDNDLIIQSFTSNSLKLLGINNNGYSVSIDIVQFIKEFYEEFLSIFTDNSSIDKMRLQRKILRKKYLDNVNMITWKKAKKKKVNDMTVFTDKSYFLSIEEVKIDEELLGYSFKFEANLMVFKSVTNLSKRNSTGLGSPLITSVHLSQFTLQQHQHNHQQQGMNDDDYGMILLNQYNTAENNQISFDHAKYSYLFNKKPDETVAEYFKREVMGKFNTQPTIQASDESNETHSGQSYTDSNNSGSDEITSSSFCSGIIEKKPTKKEVKDENIRSSLRRVSILNLQNDQYYHVDFTKIKLSIYDFKRQTPKDIKTDNNFKHVSQMEISLNEKTSDNTIKSSTNLPQHIQLRTESSGISNNSNLIDDNNKASLNQILKPFSIIKLNIFSLLIFLTILIVLFFYAIIFYNTLEKKIILNTAIYKGYSLLVMLFDNNYILLQYVLVNHPLFSNYYQDPPIYFNSIKKSLLSSYNQSYTIVHEVLSSNLQLTQNRTNLIRNNMLEINLTSDLYNLISYNISVIPSLIELNTALYTFGNIDDPSLITFYDFNYLYIVYNTDNGTAYGLDRMLAIIMEEETEHNNYMQNVLIIELIILFIVKVFCLFCYMMIFKCIYKEKSECFEMIVNIDKNYISRSIDDCQRFLNKTNKDDLNHEQDNTDFDNENDPLKAKQSNLNNSNINNNDILVSLNSIKASFFGIKGEQINIVLFMSFIFILIFVLYLVFTLQYIIFTKNIDKIKYSAIAATNLELSCIKIYNYIRNYVLFGSLQSEMVYYFQKRARESLYTTYMFKAIIYKTLSENDVIANRTLSYKEIFNGNLCPYFDRALESDLNKSNLTCTSFADNVTSSGMEVLITYYTMFIRGLLQHVEECIALQTQGEPFDPMLIFNSNNARDLDIMWYYLLHPILDEWIDQIFDVVILEVSNFQATAFVYIIIIGLVLCLFYLVYIIPRKNILFIELNQTKTMIKLIPKEVFFNINIIGNNYTK